MPRDYDPERIAAHIITVARSVGRATPSPPEHPYFDLDTFAPLPVALLERLAAAGIFRKYEHVLAIGAGLGATARWLARSRGCRVLAIATGHAAARAARTLTARVGLDEQVETVAGDPRQLPLRTAAFTHVWCLDLLATMPPGGRVPALREAGRALRPGGLLAVCETVVASGAPDPPTAPGTPALPSASSCQGALAEAGFVNVHDEDASALLPGGPDPFAPARERLLERITALEGPDCEYLHAQAAATRRRADHRKGHLRTHIFFANHAAEAPPR